MDTAQQQTKLWRAAAEALQAEFTRAGIRRPTLAELERVAPPADGQSLAVLRDLERRAVVIGCDGWREYGKVVNHLAGTQTRGGKGQVVGLMAAVEFVSDRLRRGSTSAGACTVAAEGRSQSVEAPAAQAWWTARPGLAGS